MVITNKSSSEYGNDCMIYTEMVLIQIADTYQVITLKKYVGSRVDGEVDTYVQEFESEDDARKYMEED